MSIPDVSASLQAYARCLALLADEIEAMRVGDAVKLGELAKLRLEAERELGEASETSPYAELASVTEEAVRELGDRSAENRRREEDVARLEAESLPLLRGIRNWLSPGIYAELGTNHGAFDVRF